MEWLRAAGFGNPIRSLTSACVSLTPSETYKRSAPRFHLLEPKTFRVGNLTLVPYSNTLSLQVAGLHEASSYCGVTPWG